MDDINKHKPFAIVGYILPFLFFIPMLSDEGKKSQFAMFHANQQLLLLITWVAGLFFTIVFVGFLIHIFALVLTIIGIVNAANGSMKPLPIIGGIKLLHI